VPTIMRCLLFLFAIARVLAFSSTPDDTKGCFNYYTGSCTGCGQPYQCGVRPGDEQKGFKMPTWYTGSSPYCAHCAGWPTDDPVGCWDGNFCGFSSSKGTPIDPECAKEHCTCVEEPQCVANSPAYVDCKACGAKTDPELKELPKLPTMAEIVADTEELSDLLAAVKLADPSILNLLSNPEARITLFAPNNQAFQALDGFYKALLDGEFTATPLVTRLLAVHVVDDTVKASEALLFEDKVVPTLSGENNTLTIDGSSGAVKILPVIDQPRQVPATVVTADIIASNGVIHIVDKVLANSYRIPGCYTGGVCDGSHGCCDCSLVREQCPSPPYIVPTNVPRWLPGGCDPICQYP